MKIDALKRKVVEDLRNLEKNPMSAFSGILEIDEPVCKDVKLSVEARAKGNKFYARDSLKTADRYKILHYYNESIAFAPNNSEELATSYANKSALLRRMRKYKECICETDKALEIATGSNLKIKLLCRKAECLTALGSQESRACLEKAKFLLSKSKDAQNVRDLFNDLIEKTEAFVNEGKIEKIKENKRKALALKMIADAEKEDIRKSVRVEYSEKYGRHLVAARDFEPGDILMVEKPYRTYLQDTFVYQYCYNCMHYLWTAVPCDHCSWCLFCSEECKTEAWNEYHDMECAVISQIYVAMGAEICQRLALVLSIFFKALKEAGSLEKLQADIEEIDALGDEYVEDLPLDKKFTSYKTIYCFPARSNFNKDEMNTCIWRASTALLFLSRYTSILGKTYGFRKMKEMAKDDSALFIGAFMIKTNMIFCSRYVPFTLPDPAEQGSVQTNDPINNMFGYGQQMRNFAFKSSTALTIFGCVPEVMDTMSYGNKYVMTALQPIKEGTKLKGYISSSVYNYGSRVERQLIHKQHYITSCECQACSEDWSFDDMTTRESIDMTTSQARLLDEIHDEIDTILAERELYSHKFSYPDMEMISRVKILTAKAWANLTMPSSATIKSVLTMLYVLRDLFIPDDFKDAKK